VMVNEPDGNWFLIQTPGLVFGALSPEKYGSQNYGKSGLSGYFTPARSHYRGLEKYQNLLGAISAEQIEAEKIDRIGNGLLQQTRTDEMTKNSEAAVLGERVTPDNRLLALESPSCDLLPEPFFLPKITLLALFIVAGFSAVFLVRIRFMLHRAGKWKSYAGNRVMLAGQLSRLVSVIVWLATYVVMAKEGSGLPPTACAVLGILQMLCAAVCIGTGAAALLSMRAKKEEQALPVRYFLHAAANAVTVCTVVVFEMYRFWEI
ncbi:MAG: hypothetical protein IKN55_13275, partial [Oscillospiraceae bacterium]|nr:hypothetical protein [Oscillospiraceae bacterium]